MSNRREDIPSTSDELQIGSWIPVTPVKPGSTDRQPICRNWGEHEAVEANWVKTERLAQTNQVEQASQTGPREFEQKKEPACSSSTTPRNASGGGINWSAVMSTNSNVYEENLICFESWLAGEAAANLRSCENISTNDREKRRDMSFGNLLLAMSKRASMEKALTHNDLAASIASAPYFHPQAESSQPTTSSGTSFLQDQCTVVGKSSIPSKHVLDLNAPSGTITDAGMTKSIPYQFQPLTPEKINRGGYQLEYEMKHSSADKAPTREQNEITRDRKEQQHEKKNSHLVDDQLCAVMSTKLMENHKPDKGGIEETDLVKTTQQKSRRKKHRPKVIIEGQKKRTPKSSAKKAKATQETTRVKRKYVRKNVVTSTLGGGTNRTDLDNKTPNSTEIPVKKRKYRRTQGISKSEDTDNETTETAEIQVPRHTRKSCRRSLSFNPNDTVRDEISSDCPSSNCERELQTKTFNTKDRAETARSTQETEVMADTKDTSSRVQTSSMNQLQENFQPRAGPNPESFLPPINKETPKGNDVLTDQTMCTRGKCQILFSDVTHVKEANSVRVSINPDGQRMPEVPSSSIDSGACLPPDKQIQGLKRQNTDGTVERALCSRNEIGITYNSMEAYLSMFTQNADTDTTRLYFPVIHKKNRTEKVYSTVASSIPITAHPSNGMKLEKHTHRDSCKSLFTSPTNQGSYGARSQVIDQPPTAYASNGTQNGRQVFEDLLALGTTQKIKRKRSKGTTHQRLDSLLENCEQWPKSPDREATISRIQHDIEFFNKRLTCIEALEVDARSTMATEKHSKRSMLLNSTAQHVNKYQNFAGTSMGLPPSLTWKNISPVDSIIDKLNRLDLNAENIASEEKYNAFMQYHNYIEEHYALVPFQTSGAIVPFDQVRRRKQRPKVDLDDETTRVWRLLLENINSEGIDGTNEENAKWWEEERRVFIGRADSFIARMHLVQGDRHFSPWKGSVVDSVVGVFLTQNVSDHLSSSAFMSLAARFPAKQTTHLADFHDKGSSTDINEPGICELDSGDTFSLTKEILNETVFGEDTKTLPKFEYEGISKVNCIKPLQDASEDDSIPEGNLKGSSINTSAGPVISGENIANISVSSNENGKDSEYTLSFESPDIYSQNSADSLSVQTTKKSESSLLSTSEGGPTIEVKPNWLTSSKSFVKLLQTTDSVLHGIYGESNDKRNFDRRQYIESLTCSLQKTNHSSNPTVPAKTITSCSQSSLCRVTNLEAQSTELELLQKNSMISDSFSEKELCTSELSELSSESASGTTYQNEIQNIPGSIVCSSSDEQNEISQKIVDSQRGCQEPTPKMQGDSERPSNQQSLMDATGSSSNIENSKNSERKEVNSNTNDLDNHPNTKVNGPKPKGGKTSKEKENPVDWDQLRQQAQLGGRKRDRTNRTLDSVDWDAIRCADVNEIAQTIKERGMNNKLAERIKDFLNRIVRDHGSIDLEWLRDVPPDKAKEYLLSIRGLGLKSVECVRLLTLHHLAFPVDTNVGRIAVRLGWVPLQPLPESLQLHLLELYPVLESIQQYLWPRLCKLDQKTLYELHYQMITFGKVFCTKSKPNCNACPMRGECRHFASAYASARLALPAPQDKSIVSATENRKVGLNPVESMGTLLLPSPQTGEMETISGVSNYLPIIEEPQTPDTIIEVPATPEPQYTAADRDIECAVTLSEDPDEIPTIHLNLVEFTNNLQTIMQQNMELQEGEMSKALVALTSEAASIPVPKLKNVSRLRTEHQVYELPDSHQLLQGLDKREPDDPCPYLLAIWTPGETMDSIQPPEKRCSSQGLEKLCADETCSSCNSMREAKSQTVRGTLLIPCRTAMRGSFPLNGTYFQVNEVFSDHESSLSPMDIPREWLWNLPRRTVYFGTSIPSIFKGLSTEGIQYCFWRGFVCVRGFDRKTRAPRPLIARLHFPASKLAKGKGKID